jgi:hypothetical protein
MPLVPIQCPFIIKEYQKRSKNIKPLKKCNFIKNKRLGGNSKALKDLRNPLDLNPGFESLRR